MGAAALAYNGRIDFPCTPPSPSRRLQPLHMAARRRRATKPYPEPAQPATENGRLENDGMTDRKGWTKRQHRGPISRDASDGFYRTVSCWRAFSALPPPPPQTGQRYSRSHAEPGQRVRQQQQQQHCFSSQHPPSAPPLPRTRQFHSIDTRVSAPLPRTSAGVQPLNNYAGARV